MDSHTNLKLSLEQLLRIALGSDTLCGVNTVVLHSLLDLVLKKLGCENEKVSISGYDAIVIEQLLAASHISPLIFSDEKRDALIKNSYLNKLENKVKDVEDKLDEHLNQWLRSSQVSSQQSIKQLCEDICDPVTEEACKLVNDAFFNERILNATLSPLEKCFRAMTTKFGSFEDKFAHWLEYMEDHLRNIRIAEDNLEVIPFVVDELKQYCKTFMIAMEEVQDMMDTKVDRYQMVELRNAIDERVMHIKAEQDDLKRKIVQPRAVAVILDTKKSAKERKDFTLSPTKQRFKNCSCRGVYQQGSMEKLLLRRIENLQPSKPKDSLRLSIF